MKLDLEAIEALKAEAEARSPRRTDQGGSMKRKPRVEAWVAVGPDTAMGALSYGREAPEKYARETAAKLVRLVPADPHAKLKAAVVKAAVRMTEAWHIVCCDDSDGADMRAYNAAVTAMHGAVSKLQKVKP